jgi:hypothetical protein
MGRRPLPREHGTDRGYRQHLWLRTVPCGSCLAAHARLSEHNLKEGKCARGLGWPLEPRRAAPSPQLRTTARAPIEHGTYGGYQAHGRRGEEPCEECHAARRKYKRERKQGRATQIRNQRQRQEAAEIAYRLSPAGKREAAVRARREPARA